jgi:hypothetical protein
MRLERRTRCSMSMDTHGTVPHCNRCWPHDGGPIRGATAAGAREHAAWLAASLEPMRRHRYHRKDYGLPLPGVLGAAHSVRTFPAAFSAAPFGLGLGVACHLGDHLFDLAPFI